MSSPGDSSIVAFPGSRGRRAPRSGRSRLRRSLLLSLLVHGAIVALLALALGDAPGRRYRLDGAPIVATLASPPRTFAVPRVEAPPEATPVANSSVAPTVRARPGVVPTPVPRKLPPADRGKLEGAASMQLLDEDVAASEHALRSLQQAYPDAIRAAPEFEVPPEPAYPEAALPDRRQAMIDVVVVVRDDGTLEAAPGTVADPLFGTSIRDALAAAKARPAVVDGQPHATWALVRFVYEFVGARE